MGSRNIQRRRRAGIVVAVALLGGVACSSGSSSSAETPPTAAPADPPTFELTKEVRESRPVGPPDGSPVADIRRDCGLSVPLPDDAALWIYCDTVLFGPGNELEFFVNTSAATATAGEPLVMLDALDRRGEPVPFVEPVPGYPPCSAGQGTFTWPASAVTLPVRGSEARVLVYFENVCVVPGNTEPHDVGVAELVYDRASPPTADEPVQAEILEPRLFPRPPDDGPYGMAAVLHDGMVHVYQCPPRDEPCRIARVAPDDAASIEAYAYWDGDSWASEPTEAAPLDMPRPRAGTKAAVEWVPSLDVFVMASHPIEASHTVELRLARRPEGPWSAPVDVALPDCEGFYPKICFAAEVHDHLSTADAIGLTWFDPTFDSGSESPTRFVQIPVSITEI